MRARLAATLGLALVGAMAIAPGAAWPDEGPSSGRSVTFSAEVFATPSYHLVEIPKVEEGGEGFAWAYLNQQPEGWGRAISFWPGPSADIVFRSSTPQDGPLAGHGWKSPGAWTSYPPGGESAGDADFGDPAKFPTGPATETPGGTMRILSFSSHARADETVGDFAFGDFAGAAVPASVGYARSFARSAREDGAATSTGWALARNVRLGDVSIDEIRSDANVRATPAGETGTWTLTIAGVTVAGQHLAWTDHGVSFAPGSESALARLNDEMAKGAEGLRSQFQLVPGRIWHDKAGTHVQSGFLAMGHRPAVTENSPGQKLSYALSVVSARAIYRLEEPEIDAGPGLGDEVPVLPEPPAGAGPPTIRSPEASVPAVAPPSIGVALGSPVQLGSGDFSGSGSAGSGSVVPDGATTAGPAVEGAASESASAVGLSGGGPVARAAPVATSFGRGAAHSLRSGIGLVALAGLAAAAAVLRAARRQLSLMGSSGEDA